MSRRRKGRDINGWLVVDKPAGMTSTDVVNRLRRLLDARKVGHGGTLDPLATGLLPLAFGEATKTVSYVMDGEKTYRFALRWGERRDTDDAEGEVEASSDLRPETAEIEAVLPRFRGEIQQVPPRYSAIKVEGQRAYDLTRDGEEGELAARPGADRMPGPRPRRLRGALRQGHLHPLAGPRHRRGARLPRPCRRAAPDDRRTLHRGRRDFA